jgi:hypothetical protein
MKPVYLIVLMGQSVVENQCLLRPHIVPNPQTTRCFSSSYSKCVKPVATFCKYIYIYLHSKNYIQYTNAIRLQFKQLCITLTVNFTSAAREPTHDNCCGSST